MARPQRPPKASPRPPSPLSLPGVALSLFAAIAAGFLASRALKKRHASSRPPVLLPSPDRDSPALLQPLPDAPPSPSSSPSSNNDPVLHVVVRQEIARELQDEKIDEELPVAEVRAGFTIDDEDIAVPELSLRVKRVATSAVECKLEADATRQIDEGGAARALVEMRPVNTHKGLENHVSEAQREGSPADEVRKRGERVGKEVVKTSIVFKNLPGPDKALQASSEGGREDQRLSEQSLVLVNGRKSEYYVEVVCDEDHEGLSNESGLSDCSSYSVDSEGSLQEVTSAAVKPLDPCLEEGEDATVSASSAEFQPSILNSATKDCDEQMTVDKAETIDSVKEISIKLLSNKQSYPTAYESLQVQESSNGILVSRHFDSKGNSSQSDRKLPAAMAASIKFQVAPQSIIGTTDNDNEETMGAESNQDSTAEVVDVEEEMEAIEEALQSTAGTPNNDKEEPMGGESKQATAREIIDVEEEMEALAEVQQSSIGTLDNENEETIGAQNKPENTSELIDVEEELEAVAEVPQSSVDTLDNENEEIMGAESKQDVNREWEFIDVKEEMEALADALQSSVGTRDHENEETMGAERKQDSTMEIIDVEEEIEFLAETPQSCTGTPENENEETIDAESKQDSSREFIDVKEEMEAPAEALQSSVGAPNHENEEPMGAERKQDNTSETIDIEEEIEALAETPQSSRGLPQSGVGNPDKADEETIGVESKQENTTRGLIDFAEEMEALEEAPQSSVCTPDHENEELMVAERKQDSRREISDIQEEIDAITETPQSSVVTPDKENEEKIRAESKQENRELTDVREAEEPQSSVGTPDHEIKEPVGAESKQDRTREIIDTEEEIMALAETPQSSVGTPDNEDGETIGAESKQENTRELTDVEEKMKTLAEAPQNMVGTRDNESEETRGVASKQDGTRAIIDVEEKILAFAKSTATSVSTRTESSAESFNREDAVNEMPDLEKDFIDEETLQSQEEIETCSSSEDDDVRLHAGRSVPEEQSTTGQSHATNDSVDSCNDIVAEPQRLSRISSVERNVWPNESSPLDSQDVLSETKERKACDQDRKQQTDQILESKRLTLQDPDLCKTCQNPRELSGDQIHTSATSQQCMFLPSIDSVKLPKGMLRKFAGSIGLEMALICVLIGLMSTVVWFLRGLAVSDTTGVAAQN